MHVPTFIFNGWQRPLRAVVLAVLAYGALVFLLRLSGKRTLSKMNVFDFGFVVALGSTLATAVLSTNVSLVEGIAAFGALIGSRCFCPGWSSGRSGWNGSSTAIHR